MYCTKCGQNIDENDVYCPYCRSKLNEEFIQNDNANDSEASECSDGVMRLFEVERKSSPETQNVDQEYEKYKNSILKNQSKDYILDFDDDEEDDGGFKGIGGKLVIILIVIAFVTATALAAKYFFFDDDLIGRQQEEGVVDEGNNEVPDDPGTQVPSDSENGEQKSLSSREQAFSDIEDLNYNIDEIRNNENLKYNETIKYKNADIKNSTHISDEIWKEIEGKPYPYQTAIIKSLVQFNSKWIDYVNNNDKTVLSLVEKDSRAYKNVVNFDREGTLEEFLLFEIGEIRKGDEGYYVWTHEKIKVVEQGNSEIREYYWIYKLVEGEYDFFISDYFKEE